MPAEQHLAHRTAVKEENAGTPFSGSKIFGQEELPVNVEAVGGLKDNLLRYNESVSGKIGRPSFRCERLRRCARVSEASRKQSSRVLSIGGKIDHRIRGGNRSRPPCNSLSIT